MEQAPNPEEQPVSAFECQQCGRVQEITSTNTRLFLADDNDEATGSIIEKLFYYFTCESGECDAASSEVTPQMEQYFSHLDSYYDKNGEKVVKLEDVIEVKAALTWDAIVLAEIQYADPYEYSTRHNYSDTVKYFTA